MSTGPLQPNLAGFAAAQAQLRDQLGRDVRFYAPSAMIYDPAVPPSAFDNEGFPLDPLVGASAVSDAGVAIDDLTIVGSGRCNVLFQPLAAMRRDELAQDALGYRSRLNKDLICDLSVMPFASGASHFEVGTLARDADGNVIYPEQFTPDDGELWHIVNAKTDGYGQLQRYLVFGQGTL
jgi:hypothetical protein